MSATDIFVAVLLILSAIAAIILVKKSKNNQ